MTEAAESRDAPGPGMAIWQRAFLLLSPIVLAYAALLALEGVAISWIDRWLPVTSFESATWAALFVTAGLLWCRLCLIGIGVWLVLSGTGLPRPDGFRFAMIWAAASMLVGVALLAIDLFQHMLQYGGGNFSGEGVRSIILSLVYAKILMVYPGVRLLFGAMQANNNDGWLGSWRATAFLDSIKLFLLLLVLQLIVDSVFVTAVSYLPFVAPFWFIPDELSRMRYFVGQGTRIAAESLGVLAYVAFFIVVVRARLRGGMCPETGRDHLANPGKA
ncbi:MAG: hypothetical protein KKB37_13140 [Alphaproteobacteria bacterium]|nr:hypothetical protein [Alphaproteobacteria bacterium]